MKNYVREGQKLPLFGVGPYIVYGMAAVTIAGIILCAYVLKIGILNAPWILTFRIIGGILIALGLVIWYNGALRSGMVDSVMGLKIPCVLIDSYVTGPEVYSIGLEDEKGSYLAVRHLIDNGHRSIAFASPAIRPGGVIDRRFQGYRRALEEAGIPYDPSLVFTQEISVEEGKKLGHALAERTSITGIAASADILAAGIMAGLHEKGVRVPEDKSVVGFDDNYLAQLTCPGLTTVHQDADRKAALATDMLLKQIRREPVEEKNIVLPVRLVERGSVRKID